MQAPRNLEVGEPHADIEDALSHTYLALLECPLTQALVPAIGLFLRAPA